MKKIIIGSLALGALALAGASCSRRVVQPVQQPLATAVDSAAYSFGLLQGRGFGEYIGSVPGDSLSRQLVLDGFRASFMSETPRITAEAAQAFFQRYITEIQEREMAALRERNEKALAENKDREGVQTTASGLQWRVLRAAEGAKPTVQDTVVVHYVGRTIDGNEFDSSYKRNQPATFSLLQVIPGWTEGICLMNKGAKYEFYIPSALAYGERGAGKDIAPHSTLIFEVELLDIKPYVEPAPADSKPATEEAAPAPKKPAKGKKRK